MIKYDDFQANECCMLISCSIYHLFPTITVFYFIGFLLVLADVCGWWEYA